MIQTEISPDYSIRPAEPNDLDVVFDLIEPMVKQRLLLKRTREDIDGLLRTGFVAEYRATGAPEDVTAAESESLAQTPEMGPVIVGFASVEIYSKKLSEIQCLAVHEAHRRHGLGGQLVRHCVELARQRGVMEVMAISSSDGFLQDLGFDYSLPQQKKALFYQLRSRDDD